MPVLLQWYHFNTHYNLPRRMRLHIEDCTVRIVLPSIDAVNKPAKSSLVLVQDGFLGSYSAMAHSKYQNHPLIGPL